MSNNFDIVRNCTSVGASALKLVKILTYPRLIHAFTHHLVPQLFQQDMGQHVSVGGGVVKNFVCGSNKNHHGSHGL